MVTDFGLCNVTLNIYLDFFTSHLLSKTRKHEMKKQSCCNFLDYEVSEHVTDQLKELDKHRRLTNEDNPNVETTCVDSPTSVDKNDSQSYLSFNTVTYPSEKKPRSIPLWSPPPSYHPAMTSNDHGLQLAGTSYGSNLLIREFYGQLIKNLSYGMKKELSLKLDDERPNENNWKDVADYFKIPDQEVSFTDQTNLTTSLILVCCILIFPTRTRERHSRKHGLCLGIYCDCFEVF